MNVASLELCKTLHELSEWDGTEFWHLTLYGKAIVDFEGGDSVNIAPAYDLGYLLRKLPPGGLYKSKDGRYYMDVVADEWETSADTPEDAAAKLAIELFNQGVLKKGE